MQISAIDLTRWRWLAFPVLILIALMPQLLNPGGVGTDYYNHLAKVYIQANIDTDPYLAANYRIADAWVPHLAMDALLGWVNDADALYIAGWLFLVLTLFLMIFGSLVLSRSLHGYWSLLPFLAVPALYNESLEWGFTNFLFSQALVLFLFPLWIASEKWRPLIRILLFSALNILLYYSHVLGFLLFGYLFGLYELGRYLQKDREPVLIWIRTLALKATQFVIPVFLILQSSVPTTPGRDGGVLETFVLSIISPLGFVSPSLAILFLVTVVSLCFLARRKRLFAINPKMSYPLAGLALLVVIMPDYFFGVWGMNFRFAPMLILLLAGSVSVNGALSASHKLLGSAAALTIALFLFLVHNQMHNISQLHKGAQAVLAEVEPGKSVITAFKSVPPSKYLTHIQSLAVLESNAYISSLFFDTSVVKPHPDRYNSAFPFWASRLNGKQITQANALCAKPEGKRVAGRERWPEIFDYVLWIDHSPLANRPEFLTPLTSEHLYHLYKIEEIPDC